MSLFYQSETTPSLLALPAVFFVVPGAVILISKVGFLLIAPFHIPDLLQFQVFDGLVSAGVWISSPLFYGRFSRSRTTLGYDTPTCTLVPCSFLLPLLFHDGFRFLEYFVYLATYLFHHCHDSHFLFILCPTGSRYLSLLVRSLSCHMLQIQHIHYTH